MTFPNRPITDVKGEHAKATPAQTLLMHDKRQVVVAVGPLSTGGVLLRPINSIINIKVEKKFNEAFFIISSFQVTSGPGLENES